MAKTYYHRIDGARFIMPSGKDITFAGGFFNTETIMDAGLRAQVEEELNKVADQPSSMIYTKNAVTAPEERQVADQLRKEGEAAFDADHNIPTGATTIPMPVVSAAKPVLNPQPGKAEAQDPVAKALADAKAKLAAQQQK